MEIKMMPVIDSFSLSEALDEKYNWDLDVCDICKLMFDDDYCNYSYKSFWFKEDEVYEGYTWQSELNIKYTNMIKRYLRELLPNYDKVLVDVSW